MMCRRDFGKPYLVYHGGNRIHVFSTYYDALRSFKRVNWYTCGDGSFRSGTVFFLGAW